MLSSRSKTQKVKHRTRCNDLRQWVEKLDITSKHCVKSVRIWSFSGPHFPAFGLNTDIYFLNLCIQSKFGKMLTRKHPIFLCSNIFYAVTFFM